jgi:hypothetical protein
MKVCQNCWDNNPPNASECRQCRQPLDASPIENPRLCPAGHPMDPTWKVCAFCKANGTLVENVPAKSEAAFEGAASHRRTVIESDSRFVGTSQPPLAVPPQTGRFPAHQTVPLRPSSPQIPVPPSPAPSSSPLRRTRFDAGPVPAGTPAPARKIVGILITYSWQPDGQVFPVREGRNIIGRDPQQSDIVIEQDDTLSSMNSHIIFRKKFVIGDHPSMGGTDVNGEPVEQQFHPLPNYARIRTGSTIWTFIAIDPGELEVKTD